MGGRFKAKLKLWFMGLHVQSKASHRLNLQCQGREKQALAIRLFSAITKPE